ncbi:MAG: hydrogenase maturation nickel metallochaperone HypA [Hydrogenovibrio crunogenus]|uniref:Hydrogenase maturation factor HypA n=1 Tax=Hydrogenovibrio crunogenus TaxID=39765 RepID=A0A4P7NY99_9GAMM|nr:hydrogenase maturation nickel metallochaperone HypA [Hydrogenovibrio crunogenus]MBD3612912.1 hydrogenase maturation nickel metallochaperone HypA [Hydrogenovibrio crunogenus]QBZ82770.1 hydrogenase nickel incorporation protein HypA [Hydrogenovibrio crunogenus]
MHEMSICEGILLTLEEQSSVQSFKKVKKVWLDIGAFSGVEKQALLFGWEVVTKNTLAHDSELIINDIAGQAWCLGCSTTVDIVNRYDDCPLCGSHMLQVTGGEELKIKELEVD